MPALNIEKHDQRGLAILRKMSEDAFQSLFLDLGRSPGVLPTAKDLPPDDVRLAKDALSRMYQIREYADVPLEEFVSDICESLVEYNELKIDDIPRFHTRLSKALDVETLKIAAKAITLLNEHERLFCSVRIVTDARPVYGKSVSGAPDAMVITHILKIDYHVAGGRLDEIYIGLGSKDIQELREALNRAEDKAKSLQATFEASKMRFIDPQRD